MTYELGTYAAIFNGDIEREATSAKRETLACRSIFIVSIVVLIIVFVVLLRIFLIVFLCTVVRLIVILRIVVIAVLVIVIFFSPKQGLVPPNGGILPGLRQSTRGTRREVVPMSDKVLTKVVSCRGSDLHSINSHLGEPWYKCTDMVVFTSRYATIDLAVVHNDFTS